MNAHCKIKHVTIKHISIIFIYYELIHNYTFQYKMLFLSKIFSIILFCLVKVPLKNMTLNFYIDKAKG